MEYLINIMDGLIVSSIFGFLGGIARAIVGVLKSFKGKKKFRLGYFLVTVVGSGIIGLIAGLLAPSDPKVAMAAGYAGTDFLEGLYKLKD